MKALVALLLSSLTLAPLAAAAAPTATAPAPAAAKGEARERFGRAMRLVEEGDHAGALAEFQRAQDLVPSRLVLYNIGLCYAALSRPVEAADTLERALAAEGPGLTAQLAAEGRRIQREQAQRIGRLQVTCNVPAVIELGGLEVGRAPLAGPLRVASGTHVLGAVAPGYLPSRREVTVAGGATVAVDIRLQPSSSALAHLTVRAAVPGAEVLVDGTRVGQTPLPTSVALPPGAHVVTARRPGYRVQPQTITLGEGTRGELRLELEEDPALPDPQAGLLSVAVSEDDARLTIDGRSRAGRRGGQGRGQQYQLRLPAGPHLLRIERAGFTAAERQVVVPAGGSARVQVTLVPTLETRAAYHDRTQSQRRWSTGLLVGGGALAVGAGILAIWAHTSLPDARSRLEAEQREQRTLVSGLRGRCDPSLVLSPETMAACEARLTDAEDAVSLRRGLRIAGLAATAVGVAAAGIGVYLRATGGDPDRYDEPVAARRPGPALAALPWFSSGGGGAILAARF